jgi:2-oxoglutarate ferredoxin oxidoreductase subunit gamma
VSGRYEVRLSGVGGQGLLLAGLILAEAAIRDGKNAVQTQDYGPEARGGASKSEVVISDDEINYPKLMKCHLMLAMSQAAYDRYSSQVSREGLVVVDSSNVERLRGQMPVYRVPISEIARVEVGKVITASVVALGVITEISRVVTRESIQGAVLARAPKGTEEMNLRALEAGFREGEKINAVRSASALEVETPD